MVTNDDGISSIGLHVLARTMRRHGDVVVVAPDTEYSGAGAALGPLHLIHPQARRTTLDGIDEAWTVNGPPALCTMFARFGVFGPIDLVVSGINPGANVGRAVYHSGTVGAALTARSGGISAVAVSQAVAGMGIEGQGWDEMIADQHWQAAADVASSVVAEVAAVRPEVPVVVNVNVPNLPRRRHQGLALRRGRVGTAARRRLGAPRAGRRHRGLLRRADVVGRPDRGAARDRQWGDRARRGDDQLPQPAGAHAAARHDRHRRRPRCPRRLRLMTSDEQLASYRASIDNIDAALVHLLAERFKVTQAVGRYKAAAGLPPADPDREEQQIERLRTLAEQSGLDPAFTEAFLRFIVSEVIRHHERLAAELEGSFGLVRSLEDSLSPLGRVR